MSTAEERLSAASRAVAEAVPEGSAPPLRLPPPSRHPLGRARRAWHRGSAWLTPAAAAAAVVGVVAASTAIASIAITRRDARPAQQGAASLAGIPAYYVAVTPAGNPGHRPAAVIRSTVTGRPLARVSPPRPYSRFAMVTAASDDHTFVLGAQRQVKNPAGTVTITRLFLLRLGPAARSTALTALSLPEQHAPVSGLALSPDGSRLAVALTPPGKLKIMIVDLATGASRTWDGQPWPRAGVLPPPPPDYLSWTADQRVLAYDWPGAKGQGANPTVTGSDGTVSLLDTTAPAGGLGAASTSVPGVSRYGSNAIISPDGARIIYAKLWPNPSWGIVEFSARTHRPANVVGSVPLKIAHYNHHANVAELASQVLWTNASGSVLIIRTNSNRLGVLGNGRFRPLRGTMPFSPLGIAW